MTLIVRKILASSSYAVAGTLAVICQRLIALRDGQPLPDDWLPGVIEKEEIETDWLEENDSLWESSADNEKIDPSFLRQEIDLLGSLIARAEAIQTVPKSQALLKALETGFAEMRKNGAPHKAIIFTESRRTQSTAPVF